jgi:hypothetical protein
MAPLVMMEMTALKLALAKQENVWVKIPFVKEYVVMARKQQYVFLSISKLIALLQKEQCDLGADNGKDGFCCDKNCKFSSTVVRCRPAGNFVFHNRTND